MAQLRREARLMPPLWQLGYAAAENAIRFLPLRHKETKKSKSNPIEPPSRQEILREKYTSL